MRGTFVLLLVLWLPSPSLGAKPQGVRVEIWKAERLLKVFSQDDQVLGEYKVALGGSPKGPKRCEGDEKTPEGRYVLDWVNEKSRFYRSIHVSYPSPADRKRAKKLGCKPGGDIFVHGIGKMSFVGPAHTLRDWTLGCVAVTNKEIDEIIALLNLPVPIRINP